MPCKVFLLCGVFLVFAGSFLLKNDKLKQTILPEDPVNGGANKLLAQSSDYKDGFSIGAKGIQVS